MYENVQLIGGRVLVRPRSKEETQRSSGIILPDTVDDTNAVQMGTVLRVGPGAVAEDGTRLPSHVSEGNEIMYLRFSGIPIDLDGEKVYMVNECDILAVLA